MEFESKALRVEKVVAAKSEGVINVRALKPGQPQVPTHVALPHVMHNVVTLPGQTAGFLGAANNPFQVNKDPSAGDFRVGELEIPTDL